MEHSYDIKDIFKSIECYNPVKEQKVLMVFNDMIAYKISNKMLQQVVTELFISGSKLNISLVFFTQS